MRVSELVDAGHAEIKTGPFGTQLRASDYVPSGRPVLNVRNVGFGEVRPDKLEYVDEATAERLSTHILRTGDIVFGRKGAVERHALITKQYDGSLQGSDCIRLRILSDAPIRRSFASFALRTVEHQEWMKSFCSHGATMASLNQDILKQIELPTPSLTVQDAVISVLQSIDDLIENNRRRIAVLEEMAQAIYREWFVHFGLPGHQDATFVDSPLGPIPERWSVVPLKEIATLIRGRSYRKHELAEEGGRPFVNLKCMMRGGGFRLDGLKRYTGDFKPEQLVRHGDIVLAVTDLTQGREILARATLLPRLTEDHGVISLDVARIVANSADDRIPLYFSLRCSDFADRVKEYANGSTVLHLSPKHVENNALVWPEQPLREQFRTLVEPMVLSLDELRDSTERLGAMRDLLLSRLVTGEIDVSGLDLDALVGAVS